MENLLQRAFELNEEIVFNRRQLHKIPELGMDVPKSNKFIKDQLVKMGYEVQDVGNNGIVVIAGVGEKTILLRADYDGLPIVEETNVDYKSTNGAMHACGHDIHAAMLLGTAKLIKENESLLDCKVKLMFQPGEETATGALDMISGGVLDQVDEAYMIHVMSGRGVESGKVYTTRTGPAMAASTYFKINIKGSGGHGAMPHLAIDPINIASHVVINLQAIISRETNAFDPTIISIGKIEAGSAYNIIPETAIIEGTIRTFGRENFEYVTARVKEISTATAQMYNGHANVEINEIMCSLIQDNTVYQKVIENTKQLIGDENVISIKNLIGTDMIAGSEDFAFISEKVPTACIILGLGTGDDYGLHHCKVTFDESNMYLGAAIFANIVF